MFQIWSCNFIYETNVQRGRMALHHVSDGVLGKTCSQAKDTPVHVLPRQKMLTANFCLGNRCQRQPAANHVCV